MTLLPINFVTDIAIDTSDVLVQSATNLDAIANIASSSGVGDDDEEEEELRAPPRKKQKITVGSPARPAIASVPIVAKPLSILSASTDSVREYISMISGNGPAAPASSKRKNQYLLPQVRPLVDSDLKFPQGLDLGHCRALWARKVGVGGVVEEFLKLKEGGANNDSPRVVFPGLDGKKVYLYHLVAVDRARALPSPRLSLDLLKQVSQDKSELCAKTILHLCGHKWCLAPDHFAVGSKVLNDEQTACHRFLQSAESLDEYNLIQQFCCRHTPKCWTNIYGGVFKDRVWWAAE